MPLLSSQSRVKYHPTSLIPISRTSVSHISYDSLQSTRPSVQKRINEPRRYTLALTSSLSVKSSQKRHAAPSFLSLYTPPFFSLSFSFSTPTIVSVQDNTAVTVTSILVLWVGVGVGLGSAVRGRGQDWNPKQYSVSD
eukprot:TRINITY_DN9796_c0_g1_i2.p1 TRINITY_DN9796_c0_g1~~TRINITY_DN9796_c0_g1_i2.p1  ORF type:complete len:138 (+),score=1.08 TRINITY_DN9796_c0_g1_i2:165-578(+)